MYLQLRKDILHGKLVVSSNTACLLASYITQCNFLLKKIIVTVQKIKYKFNVLAELGDYNNEEHKTNYLTDLILIPGQTKELENQISELHKLHK